MSSWSLLLCLNSKYLIVSSVLMNHYNQINAMSNCLLCSNGSKLMEFWASRLKYYDYCPNVYIPVTFYSLCCFNGALSFVIYHVTSFPPQTNTILLLLPYPDSPKANFSRSSLHQMGYSSQYLVRNCFPFSTQKRHPSQIIHFAWKLQTKGPEQFREKIREAKIETDIIEPMQARVRKMDGVQK
jgi:hypothetical protein